MRYVMYFKKHPPPQETQEEQKLKLLPIPHTHTHPHTHPPTHPQTPPPHPPNTPHTTHTHTHQHKVDFFFYFRFGFSLVRLSYERERRDSREKSLGSPLSFFFSLRKCVCVWCGGVGCCFFCVCFQVALSPLFSLPSHTSLAVPMF